MKIKNLIKHLETLDQEKELVILATDPTDWDYGQVVSDETIALETIYATDDNGLYGVIGEYEEDLGEYDNSEDECREIECYVIRMQV